MSSHIIIRRRYSYDTGSYSYDSVSDAPSLAAANRRALTTRGTPGDLLIVCDMAYISDLPQYSDSIYAIDASGKSHKAPKLHERIESHKTWLSAWEGVDAKANDMLYVSADVGVDHKLVVLAACACARTALKYVPVGENRQRIAIETAEAWTRGEATIDEVKKAKKDAYAAYAYAYAAYAAYAYAAYAAVAAAAYAAAAAYYAAAPGSAAAVVAAAATSAYTASAAYAAASNYAYDYDTTIRELSELMCEIIPLSTVIAAAI